MLCKQPSTSSPLLMPCRLLVPQPGLAACRPLHLYGLEETGQLKPTLLPQQLDQSKQLPNWSGERIRHWRPKGTQSNIWNSQSQDIGFKEGSKKVQKRAPASHPVPNLKVIQCQQQPRLRSCSEASTGLRILKPVLHWQGHSDVVQTRRKAERLCSCCRLLRQIGCFRFIKWPPGILQNNGLHTFAFDIV